MNIYIIPFDSFHTDTTRRVSDHLKITSGGNPEKYYKYPLHVLRKLLPKLSEIFGSLDITSCPLVTKLGSIRV